LSNVEKDIAEKVLRHNGLSPSRLGLRFDRVVGAVLGRLRSHAEAKVPEQIIVLVTISAPIHAPGRTADALKQQIEDIASVGAPGVERRVEIHGNRVRIRLARRVSGRAPRLIGLVHNPGVAPSQLLELAERWLEAEG
jgi:hypothetical protein